MRVEQLQINHLTTPMGYDLPHPVLSWRVDGVGLQKATVRVTVALDEHFSNPLFDSGDSDEIDGICYPLAIQLSPMTRYYWRVGITATDGSFAQQYSWFETGKMGEKLNADWITAPFYDPCYIVREVEIDCPTGARLYAAGRGVFEIYCNGQKVGDDLLDPGYSSYDLWEQLHCYPLDNYLKKGKNVIGFMLGDGWYRSHLGWFSYKKNEVERLMILAELHADGKVIGTDESWLCKKSPVIKTSIYDGEIYDANLQDDGWCTVDRIAQDWQNAVIGEQKDIPLQDRLRPSVKRQECFKPELIKSPNGELILDFGQNIAGWVEGDISLPCGAELLLQHGEILQDGCFYNENLRTAKAEYRFISDGCPRNFRSYFTFYGFRYVKVTGCTDIDTLMKFRAYAIYSDMERSGWITTGHEAINKLLSNIIWGQKGNFLDVPTDCPQRDERLGWTGDTQIFAATACYNMQSAAFYTKYMKDLLEEQNIRDGAIPHVVPQLRNLNKTSDLVTNHSSCAWGDAATVLPWVLYMFYGDSRLLEQHFSVMVGRVEYIKRLDDADGGKRLWQTGFHFADWLALDNFRNPTSAMGGTDEYYIASIWYAYSAMLTAKAAKVLGKQAEAERYETLYEEIKAAIKREYFTVTGRCAIQTQTAKVLALHMGIVDGEDRLRVAKDLADQIRANGTKLETGFCGTPFLCLVLTDAGYTDIAYDLLLRDEIPSWLYEVSMGATTMWERWDSVLPDNSMNPLGMNSLNHYAYGAVKEWIYKDVCGIRLREDGVGGKIVDIAPKPDARLGSACAEFVSAAGKYVSGWTISEGKTIYNITVPFDCKAYLTLPNRPTVELLSGEYDFS